MDNTKTRIEELEQKFLELKIENEQRISKAELTTVKRVQVLFLAIVPSVGILVALAKIFG